MKTHQLQAIFAAALFACAAPLAGAQSINIDFEVAGGPGAGVPGPTFAAAGGYSSGVVLNNSWNSISTTGFLPLRDVLDQPTSVVVHVASGALFGSEATQLTDDFERLVADWIRPAASFDFTGLRPGVYSVITYAGSGGSVRTQTDPASTAPTDQTAIYINQPFNGFFAGVDLNGSVNTHTDHETVIGSNGQLRVYIDFPNTKRVAGLQLVYRSGNPALLSASIDTPAPETCVNGQVPIVGSIAGATNLTYVLEYGSRFSGPYTTINTGTGPAANAVFGTWNTSGLISGNYFLRLRVSQLGSAPQSYYSVLRLNQSSSRSPTVAISSPGPLSRICGTTTITGTASHPSLTNWTLEYTGALSSTWNTISTGTTSVTAGTLGTWNTSGLPRGPYVLRLRVSDPSATDCTSPPGRTTETLRTVMVGLQADTTLDGSVNTLDLSWLLAQFGQSCN